MTAITFDVVLENDQIVVPEYYRDELRALFKNRKVRVTVESAESIPSTQADIENWRTTHSSLIQYLIDNPIDMAHPVRLSKEELHER